MGGSSSYSSNSRPGNVWEKVQEALKQGANAAFDTNLASALTTALSQFNNRDVHAMNAELDRIVECLTSSDSDFVKIAFGGSIAKHTYVDGLSDADVLLIVNECELAELSPTGVKDHIRQKLEVVYGRDAVSVGSLAVTVKTRIIEIQIVPAVKTATGVRLPRVDSDEWSHVVRPAAFARKLTEANAKLGHKLVPTIKLVKAILAQLPTQQSMTGYHIESLAIEAAKSFVGEPTPANLLRHFFAKGPEIALSPIIDSSGQSIHVDDHLGSSNSIARRVVSGALERIGRQIANADRAQSIPLWKDLLGDV